MLEPVFFALGLFNNLFLIFIFLTRKKRLALLHKVGWLYLLLAIPAIYALILVNRNRSQFATRFFWGFSWLFWQ